jgi:hypothetical protein
MELHRTVKIERYWPRVIGDMRDFQEIAKGENPEFATLWEAVERFIQDCFVHTGTEWAILRWEKIYGLATYTTDTLEQRRSRILAAMTKELPYTVLSLGKMLEALLGPGNFSIDVNPITSTLVVLVNVRVEHQQNDVRQLLDAVVPANLGIEIRNLYSTHERLAGYTHAQLAGYTHKYIQEQLEV